LRLAELEYDDTAADIPALAVGRRSRTLAVGLLIRAVEDRLRRTAPPALISCLDGKPLPVGSRSADPDARPKGPSGPGSKLHAVWSESPVPAAREVTAAGVGEPPVAARLIGRLDGGGYLLADGNYDANSLSDAAAGRGYQLLVNHWRPDAGAGHRRQSPHRLRSIALRKTSYGRAVCFAGGLGPLPAWVRRMHRAFLWVTAKLVTNGVRIFRNQGLAA
jgi:hypothetical protein